MDRRLLDYLPPVLREVSDFQSINEANEPEIRAAWDALARVLDNQFLETADARGVAVWEKELRLYPKDTDTLDGRKARIKAIWNARLPYSLLWLDGWLDGLCGAGGHEQSVKDYTLTVHLKHDTVLKSGSSAAEIAAMLPAYVPANLLIDMYLSIHPSPFTNAAEDFRLRGLTQHMRFSNVRRAWVRFDGRRLFDGSVYFDQQPAGISFPRFVLSSRFSSLRRSRIVRFDGETRFDGGISFDQSISGVSSPAFGVRARFKNRSTASHLALSVGVGVSQSRGTVRIMSVAFAYSVSHAHSISAALTTDGWWTLDGSVPMDGSRSLNAGIIKTTLL